MVNLLADQDRYPFFKYFLTGIAMGVLQHPDIGARALWDAFDCAIPFFLPVTGLKYKLPPSIINGKVQVNGLDGIIGVEIVIQSISIGGKGRGNSDKAIIKYPNAFRSGIGTSKAVIGGKQPQYEVGVPCQVSG